MADNIFDTLDAQDTSKNVFDTMPPDSSNVFDSVPYDAPAENDWKNTIGYAPKNRSWTDAIGEALIDTGKHQTDAIQPLLSEKSLIPQGALTGGIKHYDSSGNLIPSDLEKVVRPLATPQNISIAAMTAGGGPVASLAKYGFGALGAKGEYDALQVLNDPHATEMEKHDARLSMFANAPMVLGGVHGVAENIGDYRGMTAPPAQPLPDVDAAAREALRLKDSAGEVDYAPNTEANIFDQVPKETPATTPAVAETKTTSPQVPQAKPMATLNDAIGQKLDELKALIEQQKQGGQNAPNDAQPESETANVPISPERDQPEGISPIRQGTPAEETNPTANDVGETQNNAVTEEKPNEQVQPTEKQVSEGTGSDESSGAGSIHREAQTGQESVPSEGGGGEAQTYGIAERVRQERAAAGKVAPVESGEGISAPDSVERGRELLNSGADPEKALSDFEKSKKLSADDVAVVRSHGEVLDRAARALEDKPNSPEYKAAFKALSDWDKRSKAMQTEWHAMGMAQQGATDVDTGTFTGLQKEWTRQADKPFNERQTKSAQRIAKANSAAQAAEEAAKQKLFGSTDAANFDPKVKSIADRIVAALDKTAQSALERIKARRAEGRLMAGLDPVDLADHAIYGASKIAKGAIEFGKWSADMVKDLGDYVKPHLKDIWDAANKHLDDAVVKEGEPVKRAVRKTAEKSPADTLVSHKEGTPFTPEQVKALWKAARVYLEKGEDNFDTIRNKLATDLGLPVKEVTKGLLQNQRVKALADDLWRKQRDARRLKEDAKQWLKAQQTPLWLKIPAAIRQEAFNLKVMGHLSVGLGTHSPMLFFQPQHWQRFFTNYGRMWKLGLSPEIHEMAMQDLMRRDTWTIARRAGLENDPFNHEEYNLKGFVEKAFPNLVRSGNRAYDVLKILRQDLFDDQWNKLPASMRSKEMASAIADSVNHVTGIVKKSPFPSAVNSALFAPRLLASRYAWAFGDPLKAASTAVQWKEATPAQKQFAIQQVREKATVVATMGAMLAANQAILNMTGSNQKINFTDPTKSDWLKFKGFGVNISFGNAMLTTLRLPIREAAILYDNTTLSGNKKRFEGADRNTYDAIGEYFRNQLNPAVSDAAALAFQNDSQGRPLPLSKQPVPAYLKREGVKAYTWGEWTRDAALPIPLEEPIKQVFNEYGMPKSEAEKWAKIIGTAIYMGGTGGRVEQDKSLNEKK